MIFWVKIQHQYADYLVFYHALKLARIYDATSILKRYVSMFLNGEYIFLCHKQIANYRHLHANVHFVFNTEFEWV